VQVHGGGLHLQAAEQVEGDQGAQGQDQDVDVDVEQIDQQGDAQRALQI
jgi:hypothetical protein